MSVKLGPLPTSAAKANVYRNDILCADVVSWRIRPRPEQGEYELFTADQMRAYAEAEVLKERERWESKPTALHLFHETGADEIDDPFERLRAFCSLAMRGQDWLDVEPFFDALADSMRAGI